MIPTEDWTRLAAKEICELLLVRDTDENTVQRIIKEHCPFKPNTAYMPVNPHRETAIEDLRTALAFYDAKPPAVRSRTVPADYTKPPVFTHAGWSWLVAAVGGLVATAREVVKE
jgi:hypothetical protein